MENPLDLCSIREYSGQLDEPPSRGTLFSGRDGRGGPDVEVHDLGIGLEPIRQLFKAIDEESARRRSFHIPCEQGST